MCLTYSQGCISKISKSILLWKPQPSGQCSWLAKKNCMTLLVFFKSLPLLLYPRLLLCRKLYFLLLHTKFLPPDLLGSVAEKPDKPVPLGRSHLLVSRAFSNTLWIMGSEHLSSGDAGTGSTLRVCTAQEHGGEKGEKRGGRVASAPEMLSETMVTLRKCKAG